MSTTWERVGKADVDERRRRPASPLLRGVPVRDIALRLLEGPRGPREGRRKVGEEMPKGFGLACYEICWVEVFDDRVDGWMVIDLLGEEIRLRFPNRLQW